MNVRFRVRKWVPSRPTPIPILTRQWVVLVKICPLLSVCLLIPRAFARKKTQKRGLGGVFRLADITDHSHLVDSTILPFTVGMLVYVSDVRLFKKFF